MGKLRWTAYALLVTLQLVDIVTTITALELGALERNHFMKHIEQMGFTTVDLFIKIGLTTFFCLFLEYCLRRVEGLKTRVAYYSILVGLLLVYGYVVVNNMKVLMDIYR